MLKGNNKYYLLLLLMFALLVAVEYNAPKPVNWQRTYSKNDKIPFGCNAFYRLLDEDIYKGKLSKQKQTPFNVLVGSDDKKTAYIFINSNISFSKLDCRYLMEYVQAGNDVFMAAGSFYNNPVADTFRINSTKGNYDYYIEDTTAVYRLNFCCPGLKNKKNYVYKKGFEASYFDSFDTSKITVLATATTNDTMKPLPVFLRAPMGEGNFYFLSVPDVFANYFVVNDSARFFAYKSLSYLDADNIMWDEYFKGSGVESGSPLQFIFGNDSLYAAYMLTLISLIVFMIFAMKRKQRSIALVEPLPNATLQFVEVVGSVYYNTKNHKIIAEEKINSFYEFLRSKFLVNSRRADEETMLRISKLSTIPLEDVKKLFVHIGMVWRQGSITEKELIDLNSSIENFYKHNKR
ncbi:MAG TPA: DUF4350 domain-containing protein [Bacteroidia bacterium]|jgi:hypothetical protein|nr:DUF4350 domain-containing protein [Bacteroidia bacterium]